MDERDWRIISTLYRQKNITRTANDLYMSQPALTARIKQIEADLGVTLFQRSNKGVSFTPAGEYAASFAVRHLQELADFRTALSSSGGDPAGVLKLATSSLVGRYYLPALLESFRIAYPKIKFEITTTPTSEVVKLVKSRLVDFGFSKSRAGFGPDSALLLVSYHVLIASTCPFELKNLPAMEMITYPYEETYHKLIRRWWEETFDTPPVIGSTVSNLDISKEMIFAGLGYGILPEIVAPECPGPLYTQAMRFRDGSFFNRDTWLIFNSDDVNTFSVPKVFLEFVGEAYFPGFLRQRNRR